MTKRTQPYRGQIRTFDTIFSETQSLEQSDKQTLPLSSIQISTQQPRRYFDPNKMEQLIASVKEHGILEPVLVRSIEDDCYELVAGERRYRAAQELGFAEIPVIIRHLNEQDAREIALIENLQREDLNPLEQTEAILQLLSIQIGSPVDEVTALLYRLQKEVKGKTAHNVVGYSEMETVESVFNRLGMLSWDSFVTHRLPLLGLPEDILEALRQGKIEYTKAQAISRVKDAVLRQSLLSETITSNLSLVQVKSRISQLNQRDTPNSSDVELKSRATHAFQQLKKSKLWDNPKKHKQLEKLVTMIETLIASES